MPPAVFPAILGLFGLGLGWRLASARFDVMTEAAEVALGFICLLYGCALASYAVKFARRPAVYLDDLASIAGRTGLAAMWMCLMLFGAVLAPHMPSLAMIILAIALSAHLLTLLLVARNLIVTKGPASPALHLVFVGMIVSAPTLAGLDLHMLGLVITAYASPALLLITFLTIRPLFRQNTPPPGRPLQMIHVAPAAVAVLAAAALELHWLSFAMLVWATLLSATVLLRLRWIIEAGFLPDWSAFTFPVVSYGAALLVTGEMFSGTILGGRVLDGAGLVVLAASSLITPAIAAQTFRMWHTGRLAEATDAAPT